MDADRLDRRGRLPVHRHGRLLRAQPLRLLDVPFIWPIVSPAACVTLALVARYLHVRLSGYRKLVLLPLSASVIIGFVAFAGWPVTIGFGMDLPAPAMTPLGLVSAVITFIALADASVLCGSGGCRRGACQFRHPFVRQGWSAGLLGVR
jgi:hypothetical protein